MTWAETLWASLYVYLTINPGDSYGQFLGRVNWKCISVTGIFKKYLFNLFGCIQF